MEPLGRVTAQLSGVKLEKRYRAVWNGTVVAESADTVVVDGNHYFPLTGVRMENLRASASHTTCYWKGEASYYDVVDDGIRAFGNNGAVPDGSISFLELDAGQLCGDSTQGFHNSTLDPLTKVGNDPDHS